MQTIMDVAGSILTVLLQYSAPIEQTACVVAAVGLCLAVLLGLTRRSRSIDHTLYVDGYFLLGLGLIAGSLFRFADSNFALTAPFYFTQKLPIRLDEGMWVQDPLGAWLALFGNTQVHVAHESALYAGLAFAASRVTGFSTHLPHILGCCIGLSSIPLAWCVGMQIGGRRYAGLFAFLTAVSPLQIQWARIGGVSSLTVAYAYLVFCIGLAAGKRNNLLLTSLTAILSFGILYLHFGARPLLALAPVAIVAGACIQEHTCTRKRLAMHACVYVALFVAAAAIQETLTTGALEIWPRYSSYFGGRGEQSVRDLWFSLWFSIHTNLEQTLRLYFIDGRTNTTPWNWGVQYGGLTSVAILIFGGCGLLAGLWNLKRYWFLYVWAAAGLCVVVLSLPTARRYLLFDTAWCALAALGVLQIESLLRNWSKITARGSIQLTNAVTVVVGLWSGGSVVVLNYAMPDGVASISYADGLLYDGRSCRWCYKQGLRWTDQMRRGGAVVLVDSDLTRENPTSPAGLWLNLEIASHLSAKPGYALNLLPEIKKSMTEGGYEDVFQSTRSIADRLEATGAKEVVWHFQNPTPWEHRLANLLSERGGVRVDIPTPLGDGRSFQIITPRLSRSSLIEMVEIFLGADQASTAPLDVMPAVRFTLQAIDLPSSILADSRSTIFSISSQRFTSTALGEVFNKGFMAMTLRGQSALGLDSDGYVRAISSQAHDYGREITPPEGSPIGSRCAVGYRKSWAAIDPRSGLGFGELFSDGTLPQRTWMAIGKNEQKSEIAVASTNGELWLVDEARRSVRSFSMQVLPSYGLSSRECPELLIADTWLGAYSSLTGVLRTYDFSGHPLGHISIVSRIPQSYTVGVVGDRLAIAGNPGVMLTDIAVAHQQPSVPNKIFFGALLGDTLHGMGMQGWGEPQLDRSVLGAPLTCNGVRYAHGIGVHAPSSLQFAVDGRYRALKGLAALLDSSQGMGSVQLSIWGDKRKLWDSGLIRAAGTTIPFEVNLSGVSALRLQTDDGGDGIPYDQAAWLEVKLEK